MAAGDTIPTDNAGVFRALYESPLGKRSEALLGETPNALANQSNPRDRVRVFPRRDKAMLEGGYLVLQHKSTGSTQTHDSDKMTIEVPVTVRDKATGLEVPRTLTYPDRDTARIADDQKSGDKVFVDVMAFKIPAGQIWFLGNAEQPFLNVKTYSVA